MYSCDWLMRGGSPVKWEFTSRQVLDPRCLMILVSYEGGEGSTNCAIFGARSSQKAHNRRGSGHEGALFGCVWWEGGAIQ